MHSGAFFTTRLGLILTGIGMAVGTGNLWRFPRVAAENGGGAFIFAWMTCLFLWSIPLLIAEFSVGRHTRRAPIGAFASLLGPKSAWMGAFVALTSIMIMFYYSVVTGWTLKYTVSSGFGDLSGIDHAVYWRNYTRSIWQPVGFHLISISVAGYVVSRGVVNGIERINRLLMPLLFGLLLLTVLRSVTLPGAADGIRFLFTFEWHALTNHRIWLEALTQSAWSTGAGWGLMLTYASYVRRDEDVVVSSTLIGLANNAASLLAALAIIPAMFSILPASQVSEAMNSGNVGLTFIWIPQLYEQMAWGSVFLPIFFLALLFAALSSLIAMVEMSSRVLCDMNIARRQAVVAVVTVTMVLGIPPAINIQIFENQDWVWGLGLLISGFLIALLTVRRRLQHFDLGLDGQTEFYRSFATFYGLALKYFVPVGFVLMFSWWMHQSATYYDAAQWWNPIRVNSIGTCLLQWGLAVFMLRLFGRVLGTKSTARNVNLGHS